MVDLKARLAKIDLTNENGKYQDNWASLGQYKMPDSYANYKFGVFFHWGLYSVPENLNEWYARNMYQQTDPNYAYHIETYGKQNEFGLKDLIPLFKGEKFSAKEWMDLVEAVGGKYVIPVAEHHDGFQMYESEISEWNSYLMGPRVDVIKEMQVEAEKRNIEFGISSHRVEHIFFLEGGLDFDSDITEHEYGDMYWPTMHEDDILNNMETATLFLEDWLVRSCEIVDKFLPKIFYFDWWIENEIVKPYLLKFIAYYYNKCEENGFVGVVNYKHDAIPYKIAVRDMERGHFSSIQNDYWQTCTSSARNSWCYTKQNEYKKPYEIITTLIDVVSKNGNLLLNACPRGDGSFIDEEITLFENIGAWVKENQKAIFNTTVWKTYGEGSTNNSAGDFSENQALAYRSDDFRFTSLHNKIYVFIMNPSEELTFRIESLGLSKRFLTRRAEITSVASLSSSIGVVSWNRNTDFCEVTLSANSKLPVVLEFELL